MKEIIDYMTISRGGPDCLQDLVNAVCEQIKNGWQPYGDMVVLINNRVAIVQVMVKYKP